MAENYECRNCGTVFQGDYCPACGQSTAEYDRPFLFLLSDFASGVFSFDARLWRSLTALMLRPGLMEADYTDGRRARYVPPFRLYLFVSFFFFLLLTTVTDRMLEENRSYLSSLAIGEEDGEAFIRVPDGAVVTDSGDDRIFPVMNENAEMARAGADTASSNVTVSFRNSDEQKVRDILANPDRYAGRFFRYFTWSLFILMPLYGSLLWLFFRGTRRYYLPHFLLSMNQHLTAFVVFSLMMLPQLIWPQREMGWEGYLNLAIPVYHVIGAKRLYGRKWGTTLMRLLCVQAIYLVLTLFAVVTVAYFTLV